MQRALALGAAMLATIGLGGLGGCVSYHQEVASLRMARPNGPPPELAAYARPNADYPSVGGNILKGAAPTAAAAFDATTEGHDPTGQPPSP